MPTKPRRLPKSWSRRSPISNCIRFFLGLARAAQKDYPAAEKILAAVVKRNPDSEPARKNLAQVYLAAGRAADAKKTYEDFLSRKPDDPTALLALADIAASEKKWDEAIGFAEKARNAAPNDPAPGIKLVNLYGARQDWTRAKALAGELAMRFPGNAAVADAQGRILAASGDQRRGGRPVPTGFRGRSEFRAALPALSRRPGRRETVPGSPDRSVQARLDKEPDNRALKEQLIRLDAETGGLETGIAKARAFAKEDPDSAVYDLTAADLYARNGKRAEAVALLEKSAAAHPNDPAIAVGLARLYIAGGDNGKAQALLAARADQHPDDLVIRRGLADLYLLEKKYDAAASEETRILSQRPNDPIALNNLAWIASATRRIGESPRIGGKGDRGRAAKRAGDRAHQGYAGLGHARAGRGPGGVAAA